MVDVDLGTHLAAPSAISDLARNMSRKRTVVGREDCDLLVARGHGGSLNRNQLEAENREQLNERINRLISRDRRWPSIIVIWPQRHRVFVDCMGYAVVAWSLRTRDGVIACRQIRQIKSIHCLGYQAFIPSPR